MHALVPRLASSRLYVFERATLRCDASNAGFFFAELLWKHNGHVKTITSSGIEHPHSAGRTYRQSGYKGSHGTFICVRAVFADGGYTRPIRGGSFATRATYYSNELGSGNHHRGKLVDKQTSAWVSNPCPTPPRTVHVG